MKNIYLFTIIFLSGLNLSGQIPNSSFENWGVNTWSNPQPQSWYVQTTPVNCTTQYTNAYQGSSSLKLEAFYWMNQWVDTYVVTGSTSTNYYLPINAKPTKLFGWYIFQGYSSDALTFSVSLNSGGNIIGIGTFSTAVTTTVFTQFTATINYSSVAVPDSFSIVLSINHARPQPQSNAFGNGPTYFIVDDLTFDTNVGIQENKMNDNIKIYPNPANDFLIFQNTHNIISSVEIFDLKGQLLKKTFSNEKISKLDVRDLRPDLYFYKVTSNDGRTNSGKFVMQQ